MRNLLLAPCVALFALAAVLPTVPARAADVEGSRDHPLVGR